MSCPGHEWEAHPDRVEDLGATTVMTSFAGVRCKHCHHPRGGPPSPVRRSYRAPGGPRGALPDEIAQLLVGGKATLRAPLSARLHPQTVELAMTGAIDIDTQYNVGTGSWTTRTIVAAAGSDRSRPLELLRQEAFAIDPDWAQTATTDELQLARKLVKDPQWRKRHWPARVWTAHLRGYSKAGDASHVPERLGVPIPRRSHEVWLYGSGRVGQHTIDGEHLITGKQAEAAGHVQAPRLWVIENRDLASIMPDLVLAVDGHLKPGHEAIVKTALAHHVPVTAWFDMDAEGISMARRILRLGPIEVVGLAAYPAELGVPLDAEKRLSLSTEMAKPGPFREALLHIQAEDRFWEQERIFANAEVSGMALCDLASEFPWPRGATDGPRTAGPRPA